MNCDFRVAIAQLNLVVGDLPGNVRKIIDAARSAQRENGCRFVVYPELSICGYPPEDLLFREDFVRDCGAALNEVVEATESALDSQITLIVGHPEGEPGALFNAASAIRGGAVVGTYRKHHLPNYGVFDERRYFLSGTRPCVIDFDGVPIGITICEDIWSDGPIENAVAAGAKLIFNLNGSPFNVDKPAYRESEIVGKRSRANAVPIVYANLVGGQDELVFDGGSFATDSAGSVAVRLPVFEQCVRTVRFFGDGKIEPQGEPHQEVELPVIRSYAQIHQVPGAEDSGDPCERARLLSGIYGAIRLGVADYISKNGFDGAVVGVSGGIDSALTLAIVADALGPERVQAISMPSRHTHPMSIEDAVGEADALGVPCSIIPIDPICEAVFGQLAEEFQGLEADVTEENIQARCRGMILMAISNKKGKIVITTGNKSEVAVGYATLYGDMAGGYSAIKDVPKMLVYELAEYRNVVGGEAIPHRVLTRAPTAELAEGQRDDDSLPPYHVLDGILKAYVEQDRSIDDIIGIGFDAETVRHVARLVKRNEYKRKQAAPGVRISLKAFGRDRRYPITHRY